MDRDEIRKAALARLHALLAELAKPACVIRFPEGSFITGDGVEVRNAEYARQIVEGMHAGAVLALPTTRDDYGEPEWDLSFPPNQTQPALNGLAWMLGLTGEEAGFVRSLMEKPTDKVGLFAFADWLEERGRDAEAARMREVAGVS